MIGAIKGKVKEIINDEVLLETKSGLSFWVKLVSKCLKDLKLGAMVEFITFFHLSENNITLYGFEDYNQHYWFKLLLSVDSVGPKIAFSIISSATIESLSEAVKNKDVDFFNDIPGIGKKTATRIIVELASRLEKEVDLDFINLTTEGKLLVDALKQLGFARSKINKVIGKIPKNKSIEDKLKFALKLLGNDK